MGKENNCIRNDVHPPSALYTRICLDGIGLFCGVIRVDYCRVRNFNAVLSLAWHVFFNLRAANTLAPVQIQPGPICADGHHPVRGSPIFFARPSVRFVRV